MIHVVSHERVETVGVAVVVGSRAHPDGCARSRSQHPDEALVKR